MAEEKGDICNVLLYLDYLYKLVDCSASWK
jgi:hypothetical protein